MDEFAFNPNGLPPPPLPPEGDGVGGPSAFDPSISTLPPPGDGSRFNELPTLKLKTDPRPKVNYDAALAKNEREYRANRQSLPGFLTSVAQFGDVAGGVTPYLAAATDLLPNYLGGNDNSYAQNVGRAKRILKNSQEANPYYSAFGTGAGIVGSLPLGGAPTIAKSLGAGGLFGLTQGGTGLEDLLSGKSYGLPALQQAGIGLLIGGAAHKVGDAINPAAVKDAAKYAYNLGVKLPAGIMNAGKKGYEYLADGASQTSTGVRKAFDNIAGDFDPASTAKDAIDDFVAYTGYVPPQLAPTINYFSKTLSEAPEMAMDAVLNAGPKALRAMRATLKANGADQTWEGLQNGFMQHLAGPKGQFGFGDFSKRLNSVPKESRKILMDGWDEGQKILGDVGNLAESTMHRSGVNLIDAATQGIRLAEKEAGKVGKWVKGLAAGTGIGTGIGYGLANDVLSAATLAKLGIVLPIAAAGYGTKKAVDVTGKALSKRNVATSPTVSKVVNNATEAAKRSIISQAGSAVDDLRENITSYTQPAIKNALKTFGDEKGETAKWWSKNMPAILGGKAEGGRIAYKKGGAVHSNVEPLVQNLMSRYKAVKRSQDSGTKTLLQQPDQAIVKALDVAQKAI